MRGGDYVPRYLNTDRQIFLVQVLIGNYSAIEKYKYLVLFMKYSDAVNKALLDNLVTAPARSCLPGEPLCEGQLREGPVLPQAAQHPAVFPTARLRAKGGRRPAP